MDKTENHLVESLPDTVRKNFLTLCEPTELVRSTELSMGGERLKYAYFPRTAIISLVIDGENCPPLEVGMVGREAMLGCELVLDVARTPWRAVVHGTGTCLRIESQSLVQAAAKMPALKQLLQRCLMVRLHQQSLACACARFHPIGARLARWLLMVQDRAQSDEFRVTQKFISHMLGVRRVSVTIAASDFQRDGLIHYSRGALKVLDRSALERAACSCYEADKRLFRDLMPARS